MEILEKNYTDISILKLITHLNLDEDLVNDEQLESILQSAIDWVETRSNCYIVTTKIKYTIFDFTGNQIEIDHKGFNNIDSLKINDQEYTDYRIIKKQTSTIIRLNQAINTKSDVEVIYNSGINPPNNYIQAALITANDLYDIDRSNYSAGLNNNKTVMRLLNLE